MFAIVNNSVIICRYYLFYHYYRNVAHVAKLNHLICT